MEVKERGIPNFVSMKEEKENIFTVFDELISREEKEKKLNQKAKVIWLTGLSGSGKTTIAKGLERKMHQEGYFTKLLDGDNVRVGINNNLSFSAEDRNENIRRIAEVSKLFVDGGVITICCFVSPTNDLRAMAREILGDDLVLVYVNTSLEECERRDVKGLYKKARNGEIPNFTGISAPFDEPVNPEIIIGTEGKEITACVDELWLRVKEYVLLRS